MLAPQLTPFFLHLTPTHASKEAEPDGIRKGRAIVKAGYEWVNLAMKTRLT